MLKKRLDETGDSYMLNSSWVCHVNGTNMRVQTNRGTVE